MEYKFPENKKRPYREIFSTIRTLLFLQVTPYFSAVCELFTQVGASGSSDDAPSAA